MGRRTGAPLAGAVDEDFLAAPAAVFGAADFFAPALPAVFAFGFVAPAVLEAVLALVVEGFFAGVSGGETGGDWASASVKATATPVSGRRKFTICRTGRPRGLPLNS